MRPDDPDVTIDPEVKAVPLAALDPFDPSAVTAPAVDQSSIASVAVTPLLYGVNVAVMPDPPVVAMDV